MEPQPKPQPKIGFPEAEADALLGRLAMPVLDWLKTESFLVWVWGAVSYIFTRVIALAVGLCGIVAAGIATIIAESEEISQPAFDKLTRVAIKDLLGVDVQIGGVGKPGQRGHHGPVASSMAARITKGVVTR